MSLQLISHSPDLKQLRDEGFEIEVKGGYLLIHQIPYVNHLKEIKCGVLVSANSGECEHPIPIESEQSIPV